MPLQIPQLDDRSFEQLFAEARARIPVHTPEWTNFNDSDPGITLVQLFSFMTENLLYRSNRIPEANRRKFLTLLGVPLQAASPGQGLVTVRNERGPVEALLLDAGTELRAGKVPFRTRTSVCVLPVTAAAFIKKPRADLDAATRAQYLLLYETFLERDTDQLQFYQPIPLDPPKTGQPMPIVDLADTTSGTIDRSLWVALVGPRNVPTPEVRRAIGGRTLTLGFYPSPRCEGRVLEPELTPEAAAAEQAAQPQLTFQIADPFPDPTGAFGVGAARYAALEVEQAENVLEAAGIVRLTLPPFEKLLLWDFDPEEEGTGDYPPLVEDAELRARIATWIRVTYQPRATTPTATSGAASGRRAAALLSWVGANAAHVIQAIAVPNERLGVSTGAPDQVFAVANTPVIAPTLGGVGSPEASESDSFVLQVRNENDTDWETWRPTDNLFAAGPSDRVYTLDAEAGTVSFGSGLRGMRPPAGRAIRVGYEYGGGPEGRVAIGAINKSAALPGGFKVENPVPTWGGSAGEGVAEGERNIPRYLKHRDRVVTATDFKDIALRTPGVDVGRVEILPLFNPDVATAGPPQTWPGTVTVMVIPRSDPNDPEAPTPDRLFLEAVCAWLEPRRLVTTEVYVRGPIYVPIVVSVGIVTLPGQAREVVQRRVRDALREYLSPLTGGPAVSGAPSDDPCIDPLAPVDPCQPPRGTGWPLATDVRRQDLEATATRVPGVRYVDSIRLAAIDPNGTTATDIDPVPMTGLRLPRATIFVREGGAEDPATLLGQQPAPGGPTLVPVPVLPKEC